MKKLCYITTISATLKHFVLESAKYLHEQRGWDITFICNHDEDFAASLPEYIHYRPVAMKRGISLAGIFAFFQMVRIFRKEKFDLVQYSTPNASLYAALAAAISRVPVRLYCQWGMVFTGLSGIKRRIFKLIEKLVCSLSTWVEPDSYGNLDFAHAEHPYPNDKGSVIWNGSACGVDLKLFDISRKDEFRRAIRKKYEIPDDVIVFGFVGRLTRDKGLNELLASFKKLLELHPEARLMMVGNSEIDATINAEIYNWSIQENRIIYTGSTNVVQQYLAAMDGFVLPSYREGFGMVVIEAEAMGVPVIVSDIPGPTDAMVENHTGLIVKKGDVESLFTAMNRLYCDSELRCTLAANARTLVEENFESLKLFEHILEDRSKLLN